MNALDRVAAFSPHISTYQWRPIAAAALDGWSRRLMSTPASFVQYPYWNEPYRRLGFSPVYLACYREGAPCAYVALLRLGPPGFRFGLINAGPVALRGECVEPDALRALSAWARRHSYVFLRIKPQDAQAAQALASAQAQSENPFPFYGGYDSGVLLVDLTPSEAEILGSFQQIARRNIRAAEKVGYEIRASRSPQEFADAWPLFESVWRRKGVDHDRPRAVWEETIRAAGDCARLYTAHLDGRLIEAILIFRDGATADYHLGALDVTALGDRASPSCLLHWRAMLEARAAGCRWYNLGWKDSEDDPVYVFKRKFRPLERPTPAPLTLATDPLRYALWSRVGLPLLLRLWPRLRSLLLRFVNARRDERFPPKPEPVPRQEIREKQET